jgi:hypothetical protein
VGIFLLGEVVFGNQFGRDGRFGHFKNVNPRSNANEHEA